MTEERNELPGTPRRQTDSNITPGLGMHSCYKRRFLLSFALAFVPMQASNLRLSSDLLRLTKPCLVLVLLLCLHLHAFDGKPADVSLILGLQAAFPSKHLRPADAVRG